MIIYICLILVILSGVHISCANRNIKNTYFIVVCGYMLMIVGMRHISLGIVDTEMVYLPRIRTYMNASYSYILINQKKDVIFYIVAKFLTQIQSHDNFIMLILGIPYIMAVTRLIKKYSKVPWLSFILFLGLQYFILSFYLLRHVIALAFIIISYDYIEQKKLSKFIIIVLCGTLFHQTALIFIFAYPLVQIKIGLKQWLMVVTSLVFSIILRESLITRLYSLLSIILRDATRYNTYQTRESSLSYTGFIIQLVVFTCIALTYHRKTKSSAKFYLKGSTIFIKKNSANNLNVEQKFFDDNMDRLYNLSAISLSIMAFSTTLGEFYRIASFFGIFNIILLPNALEYVKNKNIQKLLKIGISLVFILYFLFYNLANNNGLPYRFYWQ